MIRDCPYILVDHIHNNKIQLSWNEYVRDMRAMRYGISFLKKDDKKQYQKGKKLINIIKHILKRLIKWI